jgi:hypothetical protein
MTKDHDFKRLVRERMERTGESYAAARRQLRPQLHPEAPREEQEPMAVRRPRLTLVARGHVDVRAPQTEANERRAIHPGRSVQATRDRLRARGAERARRKPIPPVRVLGLHVDFAGSHELETVIETDDELIVHGEGHLLVTLDRPDVDLVIVADGHVFASGVAGDVDVTTTDGHIWLDGRLDTVGVVTSDGHVTVASLARGDLFTGDGDVAVGLARADATIDAVAEDVVVHGRGSVRGDDGRWQVTFGDGSDDEGVTVAAPKGRLRLHAHAADA